MKVLITGSTGMLGRYAMRQFSRHDVSTLGRSRQCTWQMDLRHPDGDLHLPEFDLVIHAAGTVSEHDAMAVNRDGTRHLLEALSTAPPKNFLLISSMSVYGQQTGEGIGEEHPLSPITEYGRSKMEAEKLVQQWCAEHGAKCTILRPAMALGDGVKGKPLRMFNAIRRGYYFNLRGNDARRSIVTAYDVARCMELTYPLGGVYNICDGYDRTVVDLADAMAANLSTDKRVFCLPMKWARLAVGVASALEKLLPPKRRMNLRESFRLLTSTLTFSNRKVCDATGIRFFDTVEVTARRSPDYPYEHKE